MGEQWSKGLLWTWKGEETHCCTYWNILNVFFLYVYILVEKHLLHGENVTFALFE